MFYGRLILLVVVLALLSPQIYFILSGRDTKEEGTMANLSPTRYQGEWQFKQGEDIDAYLKRTERMFKEIPQDRIVRLPAGDGCAYYYVKSWRPLVLQHIPYGDAWQVPYPYIKGLSRQDIKDNISSNINLIGMLDE